MYETSHQYLLLEGESEQPARSLLTKAGVWSNELHEEVYVFDSGYWQKNHSLWLEIQKANWDDVILKEEFKTGLQKDVFGFFDSEELYRQLGIPWKVCMALLGLCLIFHIDNSTARDHHAWPSR